jgi:hypothetical protein
MDPLLTVAGVVVLMVASFDVIATTIALTARYTPTSFLARGVFAGLRALGRLGGVRVVMALSGTLVMLVVAGFWIGGMWLGWSLVHAGVARSVALSAVGMEPEGHDYFARTGQLLSTLGDGTTEAGTPIWSVVAVLVGVNGMVVLTLSVSFLLAVRETVRMGRSFAALEAVGALEPGPETLPKVAELVASLQAAPFALWYTEARTKRQLPGAILGYAEHAARTGGTVWRQTREILSDLPHLARDADLEDLRDWAQVHTIGEVERPGQSGTIAPRP